MRILNFGSYCIDNVYSVPHFVEPGETLPSLAYHIHPGGKGLNQSLALAYAGANVSHAGKVGIDGEWMKNLLMEAGVDTSLTQVVANPSGHANIQVTPKGENAIVIYGGANKTMETGDLISALDGSSPGDILLIQNEINCLPELIELASAKQQRIVFNAAPITEEVLSYPLEEIEIFTFNEIEGHALSGEESPQDILDSLIDRFPTSQLILTLGEQGAIYKSSKTQFSQPAYPVKAIDSTGAGDTFIGYYLAGYVQGLPIEQCLNNACKAAAISVTKEGAASSIPRNAEVRAFQQQT
jgi:ribokinase